jgi:hypothetical protein
VPAVPSSARSGLRARALQHLRSCARQQIVETRKLAIQELNTISRGGDALTAGRALQQAYGGDQYALRKPDESLETYFRRRYGYGSARARLSDIGRQRAALNNELIAPGPDYVTRINQRTAALNRLVEEEEALNKVLPDLKQHYDELAPAVTRVFASESDRLKNQIKLAQEDPAKQLEQMNKELEAVAATWDRIGLTMDKHPLSKILGQTGGAGRALGAQARRFLGDPNTVIRQMLGLPTGKDLITAPGPREKPVSLFANQLSEDITNAGAKLRDTINSELGTGIGDAITNALTSAFSAHGFGGIIEAFGRGALSSLGGVFKQMGAAWIAYGVIAAKLVPSIANPITSGFAAIAIGSALVALGAGLSAAVSGRSGGGGSGSYYSGAPPQIIDRGVINPSLVNAGAGVTARQPITTNNFMIGLTTRARIASSTKLLKNARRRTGTPSNGFDDHVHRRDRRRDAEERQARAG